MDDAKTMADYEIEEGSRLHLVLRLRGGMKLFYKSSQSKTSIIDVDPNLTVLQLKMKIAEKEGIPVPLQRLMYVGKQMDDMKRLSECKVTKDSTIQIILPLRGGI